MSKRPSTPPAASDGRAVQAGSTIMNGSSAVRVTERVEFDTTWKASGWRGMCVPLEAFGGNPGTTTFVPDYLITMSWTHVPFEWTPVPTGSALEHRYVWSPDWRRLSREVRRALPVSQCRCPNQCGHR